jgi:hypothetical protein
VKGCWIAAWTKGLLHVQLILTICKRVVDSCLLDTLLKGFASSLHWWFDYTLAFASPLGELNFNERLKEYLSSLYLFYQGSNWWETLLKIPSILVSFHLILMWKWHDVVIRNILFRLILCCLGPREFVRVAVLLTSSVAYPPLLWLIRWGTWQLAYPFCVQSGNKLGILVLPLWHIQW